MGHHLTEDGQFKSDKYPDLPPGKIVLSFKDPHAQLGLWTTAIDYQRRDPELSEDMMAALDRLGSAPPRAAVEDAWAGSVARRCGLDPRDTARMFARVNGDGEAEVHVFSADAAVLAAVRDAISVPRIHVFEHGIRTRRTGQLETKENLMGHHLTEDGQFKSDLPPNTGPTHQDDPNLTEDGQFKSDKYLDLPPNTGPTHQDDPNLTETATANSRPDFTGFLAALEGERQWSATLHTDDRTGQAASDQRSLHELAQHVERVGRQLGLLP
jgi:hypothetical protein